MLLILASNNGGNGVEVHMLQMSCCVGRTCSRFDLLNIYSTFVSYLQYRRHRRACVRDSYYLNRHSQRQLDQQSRKQFSTGRKSS